MEGKVGKGAKNGVVLWQLHGVRHLGVRLSDGLLMAAYAVCRRIP
jgi:hypothetical protein